MTTRDSNGTEIALEPITREQLDDMMRQSNDSLYIILVIINAP